MSMLCFCTGTARLSRVFLFLTPNFRFLKHRRRTPQTKSNNKCADRRVFPEDFLTALRTIAMQEDELSGFIITQRDAKDILGMGLQVSKLESTDTAKQGHERNSYPFLACP
ncbi:unnamed protein product [Ilex paraguariensis]|uniref:Uncharacterized protein n=1 Tax=Ilex paraguariensis TaxID=185542 RepID=A0ABC8TUS4_9AQUA